MKLKKLLDGLKYTIIKGNDDLEINEIQYDSRKVKKNDAFICIKGYQSDGHNFANSAIGKGANVIICEDDISLSNDNASVIKVTDTRKALAIMGANYFNNPSKEMKMIGVTGTNGKTTTAFMIKTILEEAGYKTGLIGTIANFIGKERLDTERTTPESFELQKLFREMADKGCKYCVMEVSSHSLSLDRVYGIEFEAGIFTNLTRDHLDFHKTFENYYKAKYKMFQRSKISIVNEDDSYGKRVIEDLKKDNKSKCIAYSIKEASSYRATNEVCESTHISYTLKYNNKEENILVGLPGEFNIYNSLGAIACMDALNIDMNSIKKGISEVVVLGRCEMTGKKYNLPYTIILDYAHTPDGLKNILETARGFTKNRLISVFGCGGDRDKVKRPQMGGIGVELCDYSIITSDNPRTENPSSIIEDIVKGINDSKNDKYQVVENRKEAIEKAIDFAKDGDVIVIAGKGHEDYQILNTGKIHFDEREVVDEILSRKMK